MLYSHHLYRHVQQSFACLLHYVSPSSFLDKALLQTTLYCYTFYKDLSYMGNLTLKGSTRYYVSLVVWYKIGTFSLVCVSSLPFALAAAYQCGKSLLRDAEMTHHVFRCLRTRKRAIHVNSCEWQANSIHFCLQRSHTVSNCNYPESYRRFNVSFCMLYLKTI